MPVDPSVVPSIGALIRLHREARQVSQRALARYLHTSHVIIGRYEKDEVQISAKRLAKIAAFFHVPLEALVPTHILEGVPPKVRYNARREGAEDKQRVS